jgi:hypothetical protein
MRDTINVSEQEAVHRLIKAIDKARMNLKFAYDGRPHEDVQNAIVGTTTRELAEAIDYLRVTWAFDPLMKEDV